jgi:hypothetical protein
MGYRSDVMAVFYTTDKEEFPLLKLFVEENFPKEELGALEPIESERYFGFLFEAESVKWYDGYGDVGTFRAFSTKFRELGKDKKTWHDEFVRIGEDFNDIDVHTSMFSEGLLQVRRSIELELDI